MIKDSGERTEFASGAVRDMHEGKGDMASIPWEAVLRLSRHYENGAKKYERWNYRKGINLSSYIDSACRHLAKYQCGEDSEDHLSAAAFNILGAMLVEEKQPELIDLPLRKGKNRFLYFEETAEVEDACPIDKPCKQEKSSMDNVYSVLLDCGITNKDRPDIGSLNALAKQQYAEFQKSQNNAASDMWTCPKCGKQYQWQHSGKGRYAFCPKCQLASKEP